MDLGSHSVPNTVLTFKVPVLSGVWQDCLGRRYGGLGKGRTVPAKQLVDGGDKDVSSALYVTSAHASCFVKIHPVKQALLPGVT